jgi:hypothetical protein
MLSDRSLYPAGGRAAATPCLLESSLGRLPIMTYRPGRAFLPALGFAALGLAAMAGALSVTPAAMALEEERGEKAAIADCDKRLCAILLQKKNPSGGDLRCALTKTWARSKIKEAEGTKLSWGFGDARCSVDLTLSREKMIAVMDGGKGTYRVAPHTANCVVEQDGKLQKVTAVLAPKIVFRNGRADKIWINLKKVEGPSSITFTVETAARLADTFGLFHRRMIKSINRYVERHCPTTQAVAASKPPRKDRDGK